MIRNVRYYLPGRILILLALLIVVAPEILVAFVAASILIVGIGTLYIGHLIRKSKIELRNADRWFFESEPYGLCRHDFRGWF